MMSDLNTLALQYALGELSGVDAERFEGRLATDQAAREAVADAVLLTSAVRQLTRREVARSALSIRPEGRRLRIAALVPCVAAGLAVAVLLKWPAGDGQAHRNVEGPALVEAWSELSGDDVVLVEFDSDSARDDSSGDIPDWMVAAVLDAAEAAPRSEGTL